MPTSHLAFAEVFDNARDEFLKGLAEDDKAQFLTINGPDDLLLNIEDLVNSVKPGKKVKRLLQAAEGFNSRLTPYFDALGLIAQGLSGYAAVVVGALRLVLKLVGSFPSFYEKLTELLSEISSRIPQYKRLFPAPEKPKDAAESQSDPFTLSALLTSSLQALYVDVLELFAGLTKVFTRKNGRPKRKINILGQMLWQPFDVQFSNFMKRLAFHDRVLESELTVISLEKVQELNDMVETLTMDMHGALVEEIEISKRFDRTDSAICNLRNWLKAPSFADTFERACSNRLEGTAEWLFELPRYQAWAKASCSQPATNLLWIPGGPGTGKTVLAAAAICELRSDLSWRGDARESLSYFFFDLGNQLHMSVRSAYASILLQVMHDWRDSPEVLNMFNFAMTNRKEAQDGATKDDLIAILKSLPSHLSSWNIVVDAVDECENSTQFLLTILDLLSASNVKVLVFSRPDVGLLRRGTQAHSIVSMRRDCASADLAYYFHDSLDEMKRQSLLHESLDDEYLVERLLIGADGMFEWARLMMAYLRSDALSSASRVRAIEQLQNPEKLEDMYLRILTTISRKFEIEQIFARRVFGWLVFGTGHHPLHQLYDLFTTLEAGSVASGHHEGKPLSLVEVRWSGDFKVKICRFIHHSALEYLAKRCFATPSDLQVSVGQVGYLHPSKYESEIQLLTLCFLYRQIRSHDRPLSGNLMEAASADTLRRCLPFLEYANISWTKHLTTLQPQPNNAEASYPILKTLVDQLFTFVEQPFSIMGWIEALYTYEGDKLDIFRDLRRWCSESTTLSYGLQTQDVMHVASLLAALVKDLEKLHQVWDRTLQCNPNEIWKDITAFNPSPFWPSTAALSIKKINVVGGTPHGVSSTHLLQVSRDMAHEDLLATLSIFPSEEFESACRCGEQVGDRALPRELFIGWCAHFQIWDIKSDEPVAKTQWYIALDCDEIMTQFSLSLDGAQYFKRRNVQSFLLNGTLDFPVSIGENLDVFSVLRTIFVHQGALFSQKETEDPSVWLRSRLPIGHTAMSTKLYTFKRQSQDASSQWNDFSNQDFNPPKIELYRTQTSMISIVSNFIMWRGVGMFHRQRNIEDPAASLAIFRYQRSQHGITSTLVAVLEDLPGYQTSITNDLVPLFNFASSCTFHPRLPLIAFFNQIVHPPVPTLWYFQPRNLESAKQPCFLPVRRLDIETPFLSSLKAFTDQEEFHKIKFSACGTNIILHSNSASNASRQIPLAQIPAYKTAAAERLLVPGSTEVDSSHQRASCSTDANMQAVTLASSGRELVIACDPHGMAQSALHTNDGGYKVAVTTVGSSGRSRQRINILSIPSYERVSKMSVSVKLPTTSKRSSQDTITIVLNKTAQRIYHWPTEEDEPSPMVVRKDIRAILAERPDGFLPHETDALHGRTALLSRLRVE